ncbi:hypothetical protein [Burkholderia stagnalis]|uniref:hypothetical protein n=1 Tax=Burkholderia stagnalis TaxID=1503054 RepID=UPI001E504F07|nr:hypothetical protein [Burkholderia stagnalis]
MTHPSRKARRIRHLLPALSLAIPLATSSATLESGTQQPATIQSAMTVWQTIDALVRQLPLSKARVESTLRTSLSENGRNDYTVRLGSDRPIQLAGDIRITEIDLRFSEKRRFPGFLVLSLDGNCIGIDAVRAHYGEIPITDVPHGHSLEEETVHSARQPWGRLSFGFKERNPDCLATVVFAPGKMD